MRLRSVSLKAMGISRPNRKLGAQASLPALSAYWREQTVRLLEQFCRRAACAPGKSVRFPDQLSIENCSNLHEASVDGTLHEGVAQCFRL